MALADCDLCDLGFIGPRCTWCNNKTDGNFTQERLDRAIANRDWCSRFQHVEVSVLAATSSDHNPILISCNEVPTDPLTYLRSFKFEANWQLDPDYRNIIKEAWGQNVATESPMMDIQSRLSACQKALSRWSKQKFGRDAELLKQKRERLLELQRSSWSEQSVAIKHLQEDIDIILEREDVRWKQRAKQNWYHHGDRNTQFFHAWANHRRRINSIRSITDAQGKTWRQKKEVCRVFIDYYKDMFSSNPPSELSLCLEHVEPRVSAEMNSKLLRPFTEEETVKDYRPISLCNVVYKLISKVLANRLKTVLPLIISPEQSAFIPGRLITDNIIVAFETLHTMDTRLKGKDGFMAVKLDMSKAYDRLECNFLEAMLWKLGFAERWIRLLMTCVRSVSYALLINGQPHGHIISSRGIRQGDPLSPYFFIICAEALTSMLNHSAGMGKFLGVPISRGGTRISHLLFADDSLLFMLASSRDWQHVKEILDIY
ncbi:uncharacterized protein LOC133858622 [Alnus glutinosa]|uniref:uncharacterized protein LOC133858622 n=1 Tax=Alnus glutinosa TaxID=3517 RepID=UPI002D78F860|nr:uncharacterized protein LOC133858622 [Alnus glutinosa]